MVETSETIRADGGLPVVAHFEPLGVGRDVAVEDTDRETHGHASTAQGLTKKTHFEVRVTYLGVSTRAAT